MSEYKLVLSGQEVHGLKVCPNHQEGRADHAPKNFNRDINAAIQIRRILLLYMETRGDSNSQPQALTRDMLELPE
ncbi:hypothetical protein VTP01DRAFT_6363 [Rhizomucor pusillus]|uniref:uncharacterized protein n=1 Tax=Rhizomucor pusillus TaxID=4840 RepID=UPI0037429994